MTTSAKTICAVLFDYGMVLSQPADPAAWAELRQITGVDEAALQKLYWGHRDAYDKGTLGSVSYWETIAREGGFPLGEVKLQALLQQDVALWALPNEPMIAWAARLQARGVKTGILSNIGNGMESGLRERHGWIAGFTHCTWSHRLRMIKPEAAIYACAVEGLGCEAGEVLFIDDREKNVTGAIAAGLQAIRYTGHEAFVAEMRERGLGWLLEG